jgi:putative ABC transport system ATP-binding protein
MTTRLCRERSTRGRRSDANVATKERASRAARLAPPRIACARGRYFSARSAPSRIGTPLAKERVVLASRPALLEPSARVAVLGCEAVSKVYRMGEVDVRALDRVDFALRAGELLVLLGPSGSGKSTLLNILGGLDVPSEGRVFFEDEELSDAGDDALTRFRRKHVGFVFQFYNLIPSLTARENVGLVTDLADDPLDPAEALALVGLGDRLDHFPAQLSGGEQQRVAIARAVAKRPSLLLCDEPTGALDFKTGILVLEVIERVNRELGTSTAVITHNAPIAEIADRVVTLSDGRIQSERLVATRARARDLRW